MDKTTIVTAFFDINRETRGDGRSITEYKEWIKKTLELNCNLFVVTEEKFADFFYDNRTIGNMHVKIMNFEDSHYYKYYDRMVEISQSDYYKSKIAHPNRVECVLPEYNIIQYSKFHYLNIAIEENPFSSEYFFWMDAGASRFFYNMDLSKCFPSNNGLMRSGTQHGKFLCQQRPDLRTYNFNSNFIWGADNLIYGGMFGGKADIVKNIGDEVESIFVNVMLNNNNINNEQLSLALVWKLKPNLFSTFVMPNNPMILLQLLSC